MGLPGRPEITVHGWLATDSLQGTNPFQFQVKTRPPCWVFFCVKALLEGSLPCGKICRSIPTQPSVGLVNGPHPWESGP